MKKIIILESIMIPLFILALMTPYIMRQSISTVEVTSLKQQVYSDDIYVGGCVEAQNEKDIVAELPIVPEKLYVSVGDQVEANDILADIDIPATQAALFNIAEAANAIPQEYMDLVEKVNIDEDIIKGYIPTQITAPTSGVITSMTLIEGSISTPKSTIITIAKVEKLRVRVTVDELDADKVKQGDTVVFKASATGDQKYVGRVEQVFPTATKTLVGTTQATVVSLYVTLNNEYERLKPGYTVNGVVKQKDGRVVNTLPYEAILQDSDNKEFVYLIQGNKLQKCYVKTGNEMSAGVEIISPDLMGQRVVRDATKVKKPDGLVKVVVN